MRKNGKMRVVILQSTFTPKLLSYEVKETNFKVGGKISQRLVVFAMNGLHLATSLKFCYFFFAGMYKIREIESNL